MKNILLFCLSLLGSLSLSAQSYDITFSVDMNNVTASFGTANINGNFNGWCGACAPMSDVDADGIWEITISLAAGVYEYKFTYDGWTGQENLIPGSPCTLTTGPFTNRVLTVSADEVLPAVCWEACTSCAEAPVYNDITFQVDMNNVSAVFATANINGTFNGWCGGCNPLTDSDADGIWETTISLQQGFYEYKFTYDGWTGQETLTPGLPCTMTTDIFTNRTLTVAGDAVLPVVCWESCNACDSEPVMHEITFQVDMNSVTESFTTPEVNGTFNGWCGGCAPMTDSDGDGVWQVSISIEEGNYEYKFAFDSWAGQETLTPGSPCTITNDGFTNRTLVVSEDVVLPIVCYGSCLACDFIGLNQMDLPVTFEDAEVDYGVIGFEGAQDSSIEPDPTDATNTVVKVIKSASAMPWAGTTITNELYQGLASAIPFDASHTQMTLRVWSPDAGIIVRLKVEDYLDPTHSCETNAVSTIAGEWETLTFDFANEAPGTAELNLSYFLNKPSVFFNFGVDGETAGEKTYYFDDLMMGEGTEPVLHDVTFQVDMNNVTDNFSTPEVNGNFNGWCGGCAPMSDANADGIWELTIALEEGNYEYKFAYDSWAGQEMLTPGSSCTITTGEFTNRTLNVSGDAVLPVVCWGSCLACNSEPVMYDITFQVDMNNVVESFTTPEVNGNFNGWCGGCAPMSDSNADGIWEVTISLEEGNYEYKFAYDTWAGQETLMEGSSCTVTNGGFTNRSLSVNADAVLPVVCFGSCYECGAQPVMYDITFQVDMNNVTETFTTPEVNGTFNGWCGGCDAMTDDDGDNIWELTLELEAGTYEFKYAYDNWTNGGESLTPGSSCTVTNGGFTNRALTVTEDALLPIVCYSSCFACGAEGFYNILFQVDMNEVAEPFTTPEVNGTFNNWCGSCAPMTDDNADGVWELVIALEPGNYEYKFSYDNWAGQEYLIPGSSCTLTTGEFTNRVLTVTGEAELPVVCFGSCTECGDPQGPFNVTFIVDMNEVTETFTTPEVNGTFNGWCGGCAPMSDINGDNIWEITIPLMADTFDYKFAYDTWAGQESLTPGDFCTFTVDAFTNRRIIVTDTAVLDTVCWSSCAACVVGVEELFYENNILLYPNPAQDLLAISFSNAIHETAQISVADASGQNVLSQRTMIAQRHTIDTSALSDGIYYLQVIVRNAIYNQTFVIRN